jgi:6-phosphofructokinase 1
MPLDIKSFDEKTVFLMTAGGPFSGANYWLDLAAKKLTGKGYRVIGVRNGFEGFIRATPSDFRDLGAEPITSAEMNGASVIGSSKIDMPKKLAEEIEKKLKELGVKNVILSGGDGSLKKSRKVLLDSGIRFIQIAKTHDGDFHNYDSLGFATFCEEGAKLLKGIKEDAKCSGRIYISKAFGPKSGHTAVKMGIDGDADGILIPEIQANFREFARNLTQRMAANSENGKYNPHAVVILSDSYAHKKAPEGISAKTATLFKLQEAFEELAEELRHKKSAESLGLSEAEKLIIKNVSEGRIVMKESPDIGYGHRTFPPNRTDRGMARAMANRAVDEFLKGSTEVAVVYEGGKVTTVSEEICLKRSKSVLEHPVLGDLARANSARLGRPCASMDNAP